MSTLPPNLTFTFEVDTSSATAALEFALAQLPPMPDEDDGEPVRPAGSEETSG